MNRLNSLFATQIWKQNLLDSGQITQELFEELDASIWMLEEGDEAGQTWSKENGYPGYTSYASLNDLPQRAPAFADLIKHLDKSVAEFVTVLGFDLEKPLVLDSIWVNIIAEYGGHSGHIHPNSVISGTLYVALPPLERDYKHAGDIKFEDPRLSQMMARPALKEDTEGGPFYYHTPCPGDLLLWESWLRHEVVPHEGKLPRLSISFNYHEA